MGGNSNRFTSGTITDDAIRSPTVPASTRAPIREQDRPLGTLDGDGGRRTDATSATGTDATSATGTDATSATRTHRRSSATGTAGPRPRAAPAEAPARRLASRRDDICRIPTGAEAVRYQ
ncbi:hypothetical protein GCM10010252_43030 [Streptomyces aureoverticillatus]|nr:hypothetical protein GCM10010252_43030 [Streptomyces aureoverticillatus]